jgi:hypothetical protein
MANWLSFIYISPLVCAREMTKQQNGRVGEQKKKKKNGKTQPFCNAFE